MFISEVTNSIIWDVIQLFKNKWRLNKTRYLHLKNFKMTMSRHNFVIWGVIPHNRKLKTTTFNLWSLKPQNRDIICFHMKGCYKKKFSKWNKDIFLLRQKQPRSFLGLLLEKWQSQIIIPTFNLTYNDLLKMKARREFNLCEHLSGYLLNSHVKPTTWEPSDMIIGENF